MAGDWIKMRVALPDDSDVMRMADELQIDEFSVCGRLLAVWGWADENTADGFIVSGTAARIDKKAGAVGFAAAMERVGWLKFRDNGVEFIGWEIHNSKSAKYRAQDAKRKHLERKSGKKADDVSEICPTQDRTESGQEVGQMSGSESDSVFSSLLSPSLSLNEEKETADSLTAHQVVVTEWNAAGPKRCMRLTPTRRKVLSSRLRDAWWRENWREGLSRLPTARFLMGENDSGWKADFDWFIKPDSLTRILEGKYDGSKATAAAPSAAERREQANNAAFAAFLGIEPGEAGVRGDDGRTVRHEADGRIYTTADARVVRGPRSLPGFGPEQSSGAAQPPGNTVP